jgi:hypothetical protein
VGGEVAYNRININDATWRTSEERRKEEHSQKRWCQVVDLHVLFISIFRKFLRLYI